MIIGALLGTSMYLEAVSLLRLDESELILSVPVVMHTILAFLAALVYFMYLIRGKNSGLVTVCVLYIACIAILTGSLFFTPSKHGLADAASRVGNVSLIIALTAAMMSVALRRELKLPGFSRGAVRLATFGATGGFLLLTACLRGIPGVHLQSADFGLYRNCLFCAAACSAFNVIPGLLYWRT
jgi:hypothetical protein